MEKNIAHYIDHTLLKADTTCEQIIQLCEEAKTHHFATVCIPPSFIPMAKKALNGSSVKPITVIGFPLGYQCTETKVFETQKAIEDGALEIDMVINISALKDENFSLVENDIQSVVKAAQDIPVKVIIETALLSDEEKRQACQIILKTGAAFVKTSTGFSTGGATLKDVQLMKEVVQNQIRVKASGGIKNKQDALKMIEAGADRIGTSSGVSIVKGAQIENSSNSY